MKIVHFICSMLLAELFISGCISREPYPQNWSPVSIAHTCPDVSGCYRNEGERIQNDYKPSLFYYLVHSSYQFVDPDAYKRGTADFIEITQSRNELLIKAYKNDVLVTQRTAQYNPEESENGFIKLKSLTSGFVQCESATGYSWGTLWLSKAEDGSLVMRSDETAAGLILLVIPVFGISESWTRYLESQIGDLPP